MRNIDIVSLRIFVAACDHKNIARAADQEHLTASAVSKRISQLEHGCGLQLLQRSRHGVSPTTAGSALAEHAREIISQVERLNGEMASINKSMKHSQVRVLASPSALSESLPDDIAAFLSQASHRQTRIHLEEANGHRIVNAITEGSAEIGICWTGASGHGLETRPYRHDELVLVTHPDHPLAQRERVAFDETLAYEHVGLLPSGAVQIMLQRLAARQGKTVSYRMTVSSFDAALKIVAAGLAIGIVPRQVCLSARSGSGLRLVSLSDEWRDRALSLCFRYHDALSAPARALVDYLAGREQTPGAALNDQNR